MGSFNHPRRQARQSPPGGLSCREIDSLETAFSLLHSLPRIGWFDPLMKRALALTFVQYNDGDTVGHVLAYMTLLPVCLVVGYVTVILFRRELHPITTLVGQGLNELLNGVFKNMAREDRPPGSDKDDFGMPSNHAQFMGFFVAYVVAFLLVQRRCFQMTLSRVLVGLGVTIAGVLVCVSRVYLEYHSTAQVVWGAVIGGILGVLWFSVYHLILRHTFPWLESTKLCRFFLIKDSTIIPNILHAEYVYSFRTRSREIRVTHHG